MAPLLATPFLALALPFLASSDAPAAEPAASSASPLEGASPFALEGPAARPAGPAPVQAGYGPRSDDWEFTLGGSGANDNDFEVGGFSASGSVGHFLDERQEIGVRQSVSYSDFGNSVWNASTRVFYDYHLLDEAVRPFVGANLGYVYGDSVDETFAAAPEAGAKWYVTETAFLFVLAEYQFFFEDTEDADDTFDDGQFVYTVGIGFRK